MDNHPGTTIQRVIFFEGSLVFAGGGILVGNKMCRRNIIRCGTVDSRLIPVI